MDAKSGYFCYPVTEQDRTEFVTVNVQDGAECNSVSLLLGLQFQVLNVSAVKHSYDYRTLQLCQTVRAF